MARENQKISIGVFGTKGVGKTTFFTMLYHSLVNLPMFTDFVCTNEESRRYYNNNIKFLEQNEDWDTFKRMAGTGQAYDISGTLRRVDKVRYDLIMKDYMGENATAMNLQDDEIDMTKEIRESVYNSDLLICLIDVESAVSERNGLFKRSAIEDIRNMLRGFLDSEEDISVNIPVAIVLNKVDVILPRLEVTKNVEGLKEWFEGASGNLIRNLKEDFANIKIFFYSSKTYHEKWYSGAGGVMHQEIELSRENDLEVIYDPAAPLVWGIAEQEEKLKEERIRSERQEVNARYISVLNSYNTQSDQLKTVDQSILEKSTNLLSQNNIVASLLGTLNNSLNETYELINIDSSYEEINLVLEQAEETTLEVDHKLTELLIEANKVKEKANSLCNKVNQISIDVDAKFAEINKLSRGINSGISQPISDMKRAMTFIGKYKIEAQTALQSFDTLGLNELKGKAKNEKQRFIQYYNVAKDTIQKKTSEKKKKNKIIVFLVLFFLVLAYTGRVFFRSSSPPDQVIEPIGATSLIDSFLPVKKGIIATPQRGRLLLRKSPLKGDNIHSDPNHDTGNLGIEYGQRITIIGKSKSMTRETGCNPDGKLGYWLYIREDANQNKEGWAWGYCIDKIN